MAELSSPHPLRQIVTCFNGESRGLGVLHNHMPHEQMVQWSLTCLHPFLPQDAMLTNQMHLACFEQVAHRKYAVAGSALLMEFITNKYNYTNCPTNNVQVPPGMWCCVNSGSHPRKTSSREQTRQLGQLQLSPACSPPPPPQPTSDPSPPSPPPTYPLQEGVLTWDMWLG